MIRYYELLERKLRELNTDTKTLFRIAHVREFGTDPDLSGDVAALRISGIIPHYVQKFLDNQEVT